MLLEPIHAVTTSDGYSDFLKIALRHNRHLVDSLVVVTSPEDTESQLVAGQFDCRLVITREARENGRLQKGRMVERGLQQLPGDGWRLHFDADVIMPASLRTSLQRGLYDKEAIYGCDRFNIEGWEAYQKLLTTDWPYTGWRYHHFLAMTPTGAPIGSRLVHSDQGFCPIGFWQCWHSSVEMSGIYRTRPYPVGSRTAAHDDVQFSLLWDRCKRILIPELIVGHLISPGAQYGENWNGRVTAPFGPDSKVRPASRRGSGGMFGAKAAEPAQGNTQASSALSKKPAKGVPTAPGSSSGMVSPPC